MSLETLKVKKPENQIRLLRALIVTCQWISVSFQIRPDSVKSGSCIRTLNSLSLTGWKTEPPSAVGCSSWTNMEVLCSGGCDGKLPRTAAAADAAVDARCMAAALTGGCCDGLTTYGDDSDGGSGSSGMVSGLAPTSCIAALCAATSSGSAASGCCSWTVIDVRYGPSLFDIVALAGRVGCVDPKPTSSRFTLHAVS